MQTNRAGASGQAGAGPSRLTRPGGVVAPGGLHARLQRRCLTGARLAGDGAPLFAPPLPKERVHPIVADTEHRVLDVILMGFTASGDHLVSYGLAGPYHSEVTAQFWSCRQPGRPLEREHEAVLFPLGAFFPRGDGAASLQRLQLICLEIGPREFVFHAYAAEEELDAAAAAGTAPRREAICVVRLGRTPPRRTLPASLVLDAECLCLYAEAHPPHGGPLSLQYVPAARTMLWSLGTAVRRIRLDGGGPCGCWRALPSNAVAGRLVPAPPRAPPTRGLAAQRLGGESPWGGGGWELDLDSFQVESWLPTLLRRVGHAARPPRDYTLVPLGVYPRGPAGAAEPVLLVLLHTSLRRADDDDATDGGGDDAAGGAPSEEGGGAPRCAAGHVLVRTAASGRAWCCDRCDEEGGSAPSWRCAGCDYDVCDGCVEKASIAALFANPPASPPEGTRRRAPAPASAPAAASDTLCLVLSLHVVSGSLHLLHMLSPPAETHRSPRRAERWLRSVARVLRRAETPLPSREAVPTLHNPTVVATGQSLAGLCHPTMPLGVEGFAPLE